MTVNYSEILEHLVGGADLDQETTQASFRQMMQGEWSAEQVAGFLVALRAKGETVDEVIGAAAAMRAVSEKIEAPRGTVDLCGTGGDGQHTVNVSTAAAVAVAAAGVPVAKHGNRSVSSKSGSADVLEAWNVPIDLSPSAAQNVLQQRGFVFLFAPIYHPAMKHAIGPRRALGIRTIFNLLGPLTNPAGVTRQMIGVFSEQWVEPIAHALRGLDAEHALVVHAAEGLDEIGITGTTLVSELFQGQVETYEFDPGIYGIDRAELAALKGGDAAFNAAAIESAFATGQGPIADWIIVNAAGGLKVGLDLDWPEALERARAAVQGGRAADFLAKLKSAA